MQADRDESPSRGGPGSKPPTAASTMPASHHHPSQRLSQRRRHLMDTSDYSDYVESDYSEGAFLASVSDAADITVVTTPRELQAAVSAGVLDIQIEAHLDLSAEGGLALAYYVRSERSGSAVLAHIGGATRSIRVCV